MRITTMSRYGTRAIFDIVYHSAGLPVQIKDISKRQEIPIRYHGQIIHRLKKAKIVESVRGPSGGYVLARDSSEITVGDIVKAVKEPTNLVFCVDPEAEDGGPCNRVEQCVTRLIWEEAGEKIQEFFDSVTIENLCEKAAKAGFKKEVKHKFDYII